MSEPRLDRDHAQDTTGAPTGPIRYPLNHVLGIIDAPEQVAAALEALTTGGFLVSEVTIVCGEREADRLRASTGRTGLLDAVLRVHEQLGLTHDELEVKARYEQALRDGQFVVHVLTPTEERRELAADLLRAHGAHFVNFLGRFTREELAP